MKKNIFTIIVLIFTMIESNAQINTPAGLSTTIAGKHAFLDASDFGINWASNESKGMVFPQTDLTQWVFQTEVLDGIVFSTAYDGMIVYNTGTGSTKVTDPFGGLEILQKANNGQVTTVAPGFYYFYNPLQPMTSSTEIVENGKWIPISNSGSGVSTTPVKNIIELIPVDTGVAIDGKTIWAVKGSFIIAPLNATAVILGLPKPDGLTGYTKMTTYKDGKTFRSEISSLTIDPLPAVNTITVVTGNGMFSEVYPAGAYDYTLEFFIN
jgi:hypothetical protein